VQDVHRSVEFIWRKKKRRLVCLKVVVLGTVTAVCVAARFVLETRLPRYCLMFDGLGEVLRTATPIWAFDSPPNEEGLVAVVTQYLRLTSSFVHTAFLSGANA